MPDEREDGMTLGQLQRAGLDGRLSGSPDVRLTGVQHDSRRVGPGDLFVAIPGATHDGARFAVDACERGAAAVVSEVPVAGDIPQLTVASARAALGPAAELVYGAPRELPAGPAPEPRRTALAGVAFGGWERSRPDAGM